MCILMRRIIIRELLCEVCPYSYSAQYGIKHHDKNQCAGTGTGTTAPPGDDKIEEISAGFPYGYRL
jgi:hypothetical protein